MSEEFEVTQKNVEALDKEPKIRWNVKQTSKGFLYWEFTVRGDTIEELRKLATACKVELNAICSG